ncbi:hypothetical protein D3C87_1944360 [compost metagenome]
MVTVVLLGCQIAGALAPMSEMTSVPACWNTMNNPIAMAASPIRVTVNALRAALPLVGCSYQKPMSR